MGNRNRRRLMALASTVAVSLDGQHSVGDCRLKLLGGRQSPAADRSPDRSVGEPLSGRFEHVRRAAVLFAGLAEAEGRFSSARSPRAFVASRGGVASSSRTFATVHHPRRFGIAAGGPRRRPRPAVYRIHQGIEAVQRVQVHQLLRGDAVRPRSSSRRFFSPLRCFSPASVMPLLPRSSLSTVCNSPMPAKAASVKSAPAR